MRVYYSNDLFVNEPYNIEINLVLTGRRYQVMWELRKLENQMNAEVEGRIILVASEDFNGFRIEGFSTELTKEIRKITDGIKL